MNDTAARVIKALTGKRFQLDTEVELQLQIATIFTEAGLLFQREHRLDAKNRPDFFIDGLAIEIKIKGGAQAIYRQCMRYCDFKEVTGLLLVTNRSMGFPPSLNGKPTYFFKLGAGWL